MGEFTEVFDSRFIVGHGSGFLTPEMAQMKMATRRPDVRLPFRALNVPTHTLVSRHIAFRHLRIRSILGSGGFTKIFSSIVERVAVSMIRQIKSVLDDFAVHVDRLFFVLNLDVAFCVKPLAGRIPPCVPVPLVQPIIVSSVNNGGLPLSQRNEAVQFVERLDNCVTFQAVLRAVFHRESSLPFETVRPLLILAR